MISVPCRCVLPLGSFDAREPHAGQLLHEAIQLQLEERDQHVSRACADPRGHLIDVNRLGAQHAEHGSAGWRDIRTRCPSNSRLFSELPRQNLEHVGNGCDERGAIADQRVCAHAGIAPDRPRHREDLATQIQCVVSGNQSAAALPGLHDDDRQRQCGDHTVAFREVVVKRRLGWHEFGQQYAAACDQALQLLVFRWVGDVQTAPEHAHRQATDVQCGLVRDPIDASRHTADHHQAGSRQTTSQHASRGAAVLCVLPRPNHGYRGRTQERELPQNEKNWRRLMEVSKPRRVPPLPLEDNGNAGPLDPLGSALDPLGTTVSLHSAFDPLGPNLSFDRHLDRLRTYRIRTAKCLARILAVGLKRVHSGSVTAKQNPEPDVANARLQFQIQQGAKFSRPHR